MGAATCLFFFSSQGSRESSVALVLNGHALVCVFPLIWFDLPTGGVVAAGQESIISIRDTAVDLHLGADNI